MYIFKNAFRNISRSLGRNILIGIIVTVIAAASCVALSIRKSAEDARNENMKNLSITAHINIDRAYIMDKVKSSGVNMQDRNAMLEVLKEASGMTLDEMQEYAASTNVKKFYYTNMMVVNGNDDLQPIDPNAELESEDEEEASEETSEEQTEEATEEANVEQPQPPQPGQEGQMPPGQEGQMPPGHGSVDGQQMPGQDGMDGQQMPGQEGMGGQQDPEQMMASRGNFKVTGYSSDEAMEDFQNGVCTITEGSMFEEGTTDYKCVVSDELSTYNDLSVGDKITITNPADEEETYELEIVGIYKNSNSSNSMSTGNANDPANNILTSAEVVNDIISISKGKQTEDTNEISNNVTGTYIFEDMNAYDRFEEELNTKEEGKYVLTSSDVASYEASLVPLENLKSFATAFLIVILVIGAIILVVLNMFNIRERKYEVGVLTAIGMHKSKVAIQFMLEIFIVTIVAILIGTGIGAAASTPITNKLLESQVQQEKTSQEELNSFYGRSQGAGTFTKGGDVQGPVEYVDSVGFSVDMIVILQMIGIGLLLSVVASLIAIIFIMRYQPLKILTERD